MLFRSEASGISLSQSCFLSPVSARVLIMSNSQVILAADAPVSKTVDDDAAWDRVRRRLRAELGDDVFSSWFGRLELSGLAGEVAHLTVPTRFLKSWIQSHYMDRLRALVFEEFIGLSEIQIAVRSAATLA